MAEETAAVVPVAVEEEAPAEQSAPAKYLATVIEVASIPVVDEMVEAVAEIAETVAEAVEDVADAVIDTAEAVEDAAKSVEKAAEAVVDVSEKIIELIDDISPEPAPTPAPTLEPTPEATPAPEPVAAPEPVPEPVPEPGVAPVAVEIPAPEPVEEPVVVEVPVVVESPAPEPVVEPLPSIPEPLDDFSGGVAPSLISLLSEEGVSAAAPAEIPAKMAPPKYSDLGKAAQNLFGNGFPLGVVNLQSNTSSNQGLQFSTEGSHTLSSGTTIAALETKFKYEPYGLNFTKRWDTNSLISSNIELESKLVKGLKLDLNTTLDPMVGKKTALVKASYQHGDLIHATTDVDFGYLSAPTIHGTVVAAYKGWLAGYHSSYDTSDKRLVNNNFSVAYKEGDIEMNASVNNGKNYAGSVHHQANDKLATAAMFNYASGGSATSFAICGSYAMDDNVAVKAKVDSNLNVGVSYVQKHKSGLELTLAGLIDGKSLEKGAHKFGVSLSFDA